MLKLEGRKGNIWKTGQVTEVQQDAFSESVWKTEVDRKVHPV